jgi:hypothetical protein
MGGGLLYLEALARLARPERLADMRHLGRREHVGRGV